MRALLVGSARATDRRPLAGPRLLTCVFLCLLLLRSCTTHPYRSITYADDHKTVTVHVGNSIHVTLESTTWRFAAPSDPSVLNQGSQTVSEGSTRCRVEFYCGHVVVDVVALKPGDAEITAYLTYCGEARTCDLSKVAFRVKIHVVR